ncbi:gluconokinase [Marinomonas sp. 15G1-11]|uniref:Gluconokinase n=1 Tax=Marinomonas phaeophyticola TaxID=3004091 RepID=A0ABT4JT67_9GAMM|nr:gluconokinase [Marinomonas sp. 15G1-11]MCZ2721376.1 gluconokinase [Marinomonas sp. 15G1-11]
MKIVILGVSGSGKSLIGSQLANRLTVPFFDGDDFHPPANVEKMRQGHPLNDEDRVDWLLRLNRLIKENQSLIVACSGLTPAYRASLKEGNETLQLVYLKGDFDLIWRRHQQRDGHYFNGQSMLHSQFETLIEPTAEEALIVSIEPEPYTIIDNIISMLNSSADSGIRDTDG